ncbi:MAG: right-handed parallel beta-helix repeat-containing protein [Tahibacter sp.]
MRRRIRFALCLAAVAPFAAIAQSAYFKSPGAGMHFTVGLPVVVYADLDDSPAQATCPAGQTVVSPPTGNAGTLTCSGGATASGWPKFQLLLDGTPTTDVDTQSTLVSGTIGVDSNNNPLPRKYYRFSTVGIGAGTHQLRLRATYPPPPAGNGASVDSAAISIAIDAVPAGLTLLNLNADLSGPIAWDHRYIVGNGHVVTGSTSIAITDSLVTGLGSTSVTGLAASAPAVTIERTIFEDTAYVDVSASSTATIRDNEFRANNRLRFVPSDPDASPILRLRGTSTGAKVFQGNRIGAGRLVFDGTRHWLVGGDTDAQGNVIIGPRGTLYLVNNASDMVIRGNVVHHNYRGGWSQGFNLSFGCNNCGLPGGSNVLIEHNVFTGGSWPVQSLVGEFRYNLVYGYGHTWLRSAVSNASIHHNLFVPDDSTGGNQNQGIWFYGGETGIAIYNNTFDGGGNVTGDFAGPTVQINNASRVTSLRNNLVTWSRNYDNGSAGLPRIVGDANVLQSADYNAFYSPDNTTRDNYAISGLDEGGASGYATHDVSGTGALGVVNGQLATTPFAGSRVLPWESVADEAALWQRSQGISQILAAFRARYTPAAGSPIIDAGDPLDNDTQGRRTDIGAIDLAGHERDRFGRFGDRIFRDGFQ